MRVLFVGSNPGSQNPDGTAFHISSRSRKTIDEWLKGIDAEVAFINVADFKTPNNRPLSASEVRACLPALASKICLYKDFKIVAVGGTAEKALRLLNVPVYHSMPHPSGRSRKLNDPLFVASARNALILFIKGYNINTGV